MDWQPIATAPRDGTAVLACAGWYDQGFDLWPSFHPFTIYWGTYHPNSPGKKEWRDGTGARRPNVTHWMPLPPAPTEEADRG